MSTAKTSETSDDAGAEFDGGSLVDAGEMPAVDAGVASVPTWDGGPLAIRGGDLLQSGVEEQVAQVFQVTRAAHPGSIGVVMTLGTDDNLVQSSSVRIDLVQLGSTGLPVDGAMCGVPASGTVVATGYLNRRILTFQEPKQLRFNFISHNFTLVPGTSYAVVFRSEHPSGSLFSFGSVASSSSSSDIQYGPTLARAIRRMDNQCLGGSGWLVDQAETLDAFITLDDGCNADGTTSCGRGACFRTIPECDRYGDFYQCRPNLCTSDADCRLDWNHPEMGKYPGAICNNPTNLDYQGTCPSQAEICNNDVDDDCNGSTDDNCQ